MLSLRELQWAFTRAVFDPAALPHVRGLVLPARLDAGERLGVYRNNVFSNYRQALRGVYPVVERLVGREFFDHAADRFIPVAPSRSGDIHDFGAGFPDFLAGFPGAQALVYLPDTARLEWLVHEAFHAADHASVDFERLRRVPAQAYGGLRLRLHPACRLIASPYPIHRLWQANQPEYVRDETIDLWSGGVSLLVRRPHHAVVLQPLEQGEFILLSELAAGRSVLHAFERAAAVEPQFDLSEFLRRHVLALNLVDFA